MIIFILQCLGHPLIGRTFEMQFQILLQSFINNLLKLQKRKKHDRTISDAGVSYKKYNKPSKLQYQMKMINEELIVRCRGPNPS